MKISYLYIYILLFSINLDAQLEHNLYNLDFVPQSQWINPAVKPKTKFHFGVGGMLNTSFPVSYHDIVEKKINDTLYINAQRLLSNLNTNNHFQLAVSPDISFGFSLTKGYFQAGVRENISFNFSAPKDFFQFLIEGNGQASTLGQFQNIGNFKINGTHYREFFVGGSYQINPKWSFGLRVKYLVGYENIKTVKSDIAIKTDPSTYTITMKGDYEVLTSGLDSNLGDKYKSTSFFSSGNSGFGLDAGAHYKFNDKIKFSASIIDLGFITWNENNKITKNKNPSATYEFSGIDLYNVVSNSQNNYLQNILDTMQKTFDFEETRTTNSYTSSLYSKIYLGADYQVSKRINIGAMSAFQLVNSALLPSLSVYGRANIFKVAQAQLNYQINQNSLANLGLGLALNLGPIQYYFTSDNILGSAFSPLSSKNISLRTGLNIQWSYGKEKEMLFKSKTLDIQTSQIIPSLPAEKVDIYFNDSDKDLVNDTLDQCPDVVGITNNGCPESSFFPEIENGSVYIFNKDLANFSYYYNQKFNQLISKLNSETNLRASIQIHSSKEELDANPDIGKRRTKFLMDKLIESGIELSRVIIITHNYIVAVTKENNDFDKMMLRCAEVTLKKF